MNPIRRTIAISAATLVVAASTIPLAGSAFACDIVVDSYTGSARCVDVPQPSSSAVGLSLAWPWISLAVVLVIAAAVFLARGSLKRPPALAPRKAKIATSTELSAGKQAETQTPRTA